MQCTLSHSHGFKSNFPSRDKSKHWSVHSRTFGSIKSILKCDATKFDEPGHFHTLGLGRQEHPFKFSFSDVNEHISLFNEKSTLSLVQGPDDYLFCFLVEFLWYKLEPTSCEYIFYTQFIHVSLLTHDFPSRSGDKLMLDFQDTNMKNNQEL